MKQKPMIGITCNYDEGDQIGILTAMGVARQKWQFLADNYISAVEQAGGVPVILPIFERFETCRELLGHLDGIILSGGNDVSPQCYGEPVSGKCGVLSSARDDQDLAIASWLLKERTRPVHTVHLNQGTRLYEIFGCETLSVNSYHHSAVKSLADCFTAAGHSEDGVLEAMELPGHPFFLAVQWHPEMMFDDHIQQKLFQTFVHACEAGTHKNT